MDRNKRQGDFFRRALCLALTGLLMAAGLWGCGKQEEKLVWSGNSQISDRNVIVPEENDKYRTFYEIFVYSFCDSNGDGVGDLNGVIEKLDYLNDGDPETDTDLGITGIWLMPIMPSNSYHKYDVKDYMAIDPSYGTMEDFERLLEECKKRDINVIIDLVMNHTSSSHPWFAEACDYLKSLGDGEASGEECPYFDYYHFNKGMVWGYSQVPGTDWYYEAPFTGEMPDLNLYNPEVRKEFEEICRFWLEKGVAGFRLDAVKEYVSDDTEANIEILTWFNDMVKGIDPDAYLVGEAWINQPEYAKYYASGVDSFFDFVFAGDEGRIFRLASGQYEARQYGDYVATAEQRYAEYSDSFINAPFYSNHDMDRAAGYYTGENAQAQIKMAAALNLTMSGNAFIYYGDEIGMLGAGRDENKRLGMRWTPDTGAAGTCRGPLGADTVEQVYGSVEEQQVDPDSIYWFYKNLIRLRNQFPAIAKGTTTNLEKASDAELSVIEKTYGGQTVCILYNLSSSDKEIELTSVILSEGDTLEKKQMVTALSAGEGAAAADGGTLMVPAYSLAVFLVSEEEGK